MNSKTPHGKAMNATREVRTPPSILHCKPKVSPLRLTKLNEDPFWILKPPIRANKRVRQRPALSDGDAQLRGDPGRPDSIPVELQGGVEPEATERTAGEEE